MILFTMFNLSARDFSGLPHYSKMFVEYFTGKHDLVLLNIIADTKENQRIEETEVSGNICFNVYTPKFLNDFDNNLQQLILNILSSFKIDSVILQDYLLQEYFQIEQMNNIKKIFFIHLLYRGMLDCMLKEPYSNQMLEGMNGVNDLAKKAWIEWKAVMTSDIIICNSRFTFSELHRFYWNCNLKDKEIIIAPLGIEDDYFIDGENLASKKWCYFGRITAQKGMYYLMRDVTDNLKKYKKNPLIIIGEGDMDNFFWRTMFYDHAIEYRGLMEPDDLREVLKDIKYCIFPSIYEPWGLALTEALAMGKICIVNKRAGGPLEQIKDGVNGFVHRMDDGIIDFINELETYDLSDVAQEAKKSARKMQDHFKILEKAI